MSNKFTTLQAIVNSGVVAVVRGDSKEEAYNAAVACIEGGVTAIELTFTVPHADEVIADLSARYAADPAVVIGAGTVLEAATARVAILAGARFIVSATCTKEVALLCNLYAIPYTPGCMTPTEVQTALTYGADLIKIFPGSAVGQSMVSALHGPFPQADFMVTGGVSLDNLADWYARGAKVVGAGSNLLRPAASGDFAQVKQNAQAYRQAVLATRQ